MNQQDNNQREKPNKSPLILRILWIIGVVLLLAVATVLGYIFGRFMNDKCDLATVVKFINS